MFEMLGKLNSLIELGVYIKTLDGKLDTTLMPQEIVSLIIGVMSYASECEYKNIQSRSTKGQSIAISKGVKLGRKKTYDANQVVEIMKKRSEGNGYGTIARAMGMSRSMIQRIIQNELGGVAA